MEILQFGEGVFLRAFLDWMVQLMNERCSFNAEITIVQPRGVELNRASTRLNAQSGRYTVVERGMENGNQLERFTPVNCVKRVIGGYDRSALREAATDPALRYVFSNTTEAGIVYSPGEDTFPAKVAYLLQARCAAGLPGLVFLPCELIERNGEALKDCVLKYLETDAETSRYVNSECRFFNTLVDRIVSGAPSNADAERYQQQLGFDDGMIDCTEPFHFMAVESPDRDFSPLPPFAAAGLNVECVDDLAPYRTRKVRFLNGAHTGCVPGALLDGIAEVAEMVANPKWRSFMETMLREEVAPTVPLPEEEKNAYIDSVLERFENPFAHHRLSAIALNSIAKWRVRILPSIMDYQRLFNRVPPCLAHSLQLLIDFLLANPNLADDAAAQRFFASRPGRNEILSNVSLWGTDCSGWF